MTDTKQDLVINLVNTIETIETQLSDYQDKLTKEYPAFKDFLERSQTAQEQITATWDMIKASMVDNGIKSVKGPFGSITIAERTSYKANMNELADEYKKPSADVKKIGAYHALTGELPQGVEATTTQFLTKRLKKGE